ncbi:antibiotic biosynthesis monooxygenase [Cognatiyoonia sp. IB215446]|uniref:antibiotic biosynthesis monooxygenase family protein n=1 Tax=Cognatiyoonia sp. IB215446 TaxID=3097355 RepID=UPI002A114AC7|nr:antibiotic biosynthesis monooxygenase [Cognatiyoonia sp. IB215446]MDX8348409.1 antibiotic biosynthesis monooxygenase [Cognatiyoonia sp. IB215446]
MIAVIFEATPTEGQMDTYLEHARRLRPLLDAHPGFLSVERFRSLTDQNKLLSLSFFTDEAAIARWRKAHEHRNTQSAGRSGIFADYRLRIADVSRDYGLHDRAQAPKDSRLHHG